MELSPGNDFALTAVVQDREVVPIQQDQVKECFVNARASGDEQVDAEVYAALIDKSDTFKATEHIPTLKTLADKVCFAAPEDPACAILHNTLQADCFQLLMRTLKFEVQTHKIWLKKCSGVDTSNFWARQEFKIALEEAFKR